MVKLINFLLYSNIYIALCAVAMTAQTLYLLELNPRASLPLLGLVFFSTLAIYALHRLVSLSKVDKELKVERFNIIGSYKSHVQIYAAIGVLGAAVAFFWLQLATQVVLLLPALLSIAYVLPFIGRKKLRLRDVNFVKIFLVALVWAYVTVLLPLIEYGLSLNSTLLLMCLERALFIFIITLPFDLRDRELDLRNGVLTIPTKIGTKDTLYLAAICLLVWVGLVAFLYANDWRVVLGLLLSGGSTGVLVYYSPQQKHDYYFTALMDGTMLLQWGLVYGLAFYALL